MTVLKHFLYVLILAPIVLSAVPTQKSPSVENPTIVVEPDQTDIYAIPLDEDAEDQQEELESLEHPKKNGL